MKIRSLLIFASIAFIAMISVKTAAQWVQSTFPTGNHVTDMMFYGNILYVATSENGIYQTTDFTNWNPLNNGLTTSHVNQIISSVEGSYVSFYAATDAGVFRSTMMGYSWTPVNNGLTNLNVGTIFSDGTMLYAGTQQGSFRSDNYGQSWTPISIGTPSQVVDCFFKNGPDMLAGLYGQGEYLYRSVDNGITWNSYGTGLYETNQIGKLDGELFAVSITIMYHSLDNGATWSQVGPGLVPGMPIFDITTGYEYLWIATMAGGYVQHTDSTNFRMITSGMPLGGTNLSAVAINDEWIVFGSIDNGVWYEPVDVITGIDDPLAPRDVFACFPNPTAGKFQITSASWRTKHQTNSKFQAPSTKHQTNSKEQIQKIEIIDLYGKSMTINNNRTMEQLNSRTVELDISYLPAGIYFIRIKLENQTIVKKIIKL